MQLDAILSGLIRVGKVTARDPSAGRVRVFFPDTALTSGWLYCLQASGSITISNENGHSHSATVGTWTPAINQIVICLFLPIPNADGFVLGATIGGAT